MKQLEEAGEDTVAITCGGGSTVHNLSSAGGVDFLQTKIDTDVEKYFYIHVTSKYIQCHIMGKSADSTVGSSSSNALRHFLAQKVF